MEKEEDMEEVRTVIAPLPGMPSGAEVGVGAAVEVSGAGRMMLYFTKFPWTFFDTDSAFTMPARKKALGPRYLGFGSDN